MDVFVLINKLKLFGSKGLLNNIFLDSLEPIITFHNILMDLKCH